MSRTVRPFHCRADLGGIAVEDGHDVEAALPEAAVLHQRAADLARADHADLIAPLEPEDLAEPIGQLGHRIAEAALAERAEEREVLPHLRRGRAAARRQRAGADRLDSLPLELLEKAQVEREPADGGLGDLTHGRHFCETFHKATAPSTLRQRAHAAAPRRPRAPAPRAGIAAGTPTARATSATRAGAQPVSSRSPRAICFRRKPNSPTTSRRKLRCSAGRPAARRAASAAAPPSPPSAADGTRRPAR